MKTNALELIYLNLNTKIICSFSHFYLCLCLFFEQYIVSILFLRSVWCCVLYQYQYPNLYLIHHTRFKNEAGEKKNIRREDNQTSVSNNPLSSQFNETNIFIFFVQIIFVLITFHDQLCKHLT